MWCAGVNAAGDVLRGAATAASAAAGALTERLRGLLSQPGDLAQLQLSDIRETAGQVAIVTGKLDHHKHAAAAI